MSAATISGAQLLCYINGQLFGRIVGFNYQSSTPSIDVRGIDSDQPFEFMSGTTSLTGSISCYRLSGDGGLENLGVTSKYADLTLLKYFSIQIIDRKNNLSIFKAQKCRLENQNWSVGSRGIMQGSFSFKGFAYDTEAP